MTPSGRLSAGAVAIPVGLSWPLLVAAGTFLLLLALPERLMVDGDVYLHVAIGRWIIEHGRVPAFEPFSFTLRGAPWTAHEWLSEVVFAGAYTLGGWIGAVIVAAAATSAALAILNRFLLRHLEAIYALLFTAMAASLLAFHLLARPHALVAPLLVSWGIGLVNARQQNHFPPWQLAALMAVWSNLHGSFVLGLVLVAAFAAEALLAAAPGVERQRTARGWGGFLILALLASMATPFGLRGLLFAAELDQMPFALSVIGEWRSLNFQRLQPLEISLMIAAAAILARGIRLPPVRIVLLLALLHLALKHARHVDLLALLAPVIVAGPFAAQWSATRDGTRQVIVIDRFFAALALPARPATIAVVFALLAAAAWMAGQGKAVQPLAAVTPEAALRAVREGGVRGPVFNAYEFGGYLIFSGTPPFIDGRADLYGDAFLKTYMEAINLNAPELLPRLLDGYRIGWTLLQPGMPAVALLDYLPGWRRLHADKVAVVHVRDPQAGHRSATPEK